MIKKMVKWVEDKVKVIAMLYQQKLGIGNITYILCPDKVVFYCDGYFFCQHEDMWRGEGKEW